MPPEVFTTEWKNPVNNTPDDFRNHMREASKLLSDAGWTLQENIVEDNDCGFFCGIMRTVGLSSARKENVLRNAEGEVLTAEFLLDNPDFQNIVLPYVQNLQKLGIKAERPHGRQRQYKRREDAHDYDIIIDNFAQSNSPGNEQRDFWGSAAADQRRQPQYRRHQEPGDRQADRQGRVRQGPRRSASRQPTRSTACCCGTTTSCRIGTIPSSAW